MVTLRLNAFAQGERVAGSDGERTLLGAPLPALITVFIARRIWDEMCQNENEPRLLCQNLTVVLFTLSNTLDEDKMAILLPFPF